MTGTLYPCSDGTLPPSLVFVLYRTISIVACLLGCVGDRVEGLDLFIFVCVCSFFFFLLLLPFGAGGVKPFRWGVGPGFGGRVRESDCVEGPGGLG